MLGFTKDVLRYIIVAKLPNIYVIAHEPYAGWFINKFYFIFCKTKKNLFFMFLKID